MSGKKRNFTLQERSLLLEIIKSFKNIVENKKTDNVSSAAKKHAWTAIAERYNTSAIVSESASGEQLRRLWTNLKTRQRDALTKERQYRLATGGGSPCPDADIDPDVAEIAPALLVEVPNAIDSDCSELPHTQEIQDTLESAGASLLEISSPQQVHQVYSQLQLSTSLQSQPAISTVSNTIQQLQSSASTQPSSQLQPLTNAQSTNYLQIYTQQINHEMRSESPPQQTNRPPTTQPHSMRRPSQLPSSTSTRPPEDIEEHSLNEKKLRVQILKMEHINRMKRADELHKLECKQLDEKHNIEILILKEKLREAKARAEIAQKDLCDKN